MGEPVGFVGGEGLGEGDLRFFQRTRHVAPYRRYPGPDRPRHPNPVAGRVGTGDGDVGAELSPVDVAGEQLRAAELRMLVRVHRRALCPACQLPGDERLPGVAELEEGRTPRAAEAVDQLRFGHPGECFASKAFPLGGLLLRTVACTYAASTAARSGSSSASATRISPRKSAASDVVTRCTRWRIFAILCRGGIGRLEARHQMASHPFGYGPPALELVGNLAMQRPPDGRWWVFNERLPPQVVPEPQLVAVFGEPPRTRGRQR